MKKFVIIQEFGSPLVLAKRVIVVRDQDVASTLGHFNLKSFKDISSFEKYLEENSICILSSDDVYKKLIKSLSV